MNLGFLASLILVFSTPTFAAEFVAVAKHAGGIQCNEHSGIAIEKMKEELKPILVLRMARKTAHSSQITLCGTPDSWYNVFWIKSEDWPRAREKGFTIFKDAPTRIKSKVVSYRHKAQSL